jgi:mitochondrial ornithine carrier protein
MRQAAGMVSKVFEHPFDLTKVRLQAQVLDVTARFSGPVDCLTKTWRNEGISGLYRVSSGRVHCANHIIY